MTTGDNIREKLKGIMLIIPSLDPDEKLIQVINGMIEAGFSNVLLVNDGSDAQHMTPFCQAKDFPECTVLTHERNMGKGIALKTAFYHIIQSRPDIKGVVTADGDNQHLPADAVKLALGLLSEPDTVMMGVRNFKEKHVPFHNRMGNTITSLVFKFLCGIKLSDTQTGLRGIPAKQLPSFLNVGGDRFEYETNVLLFMKTAGLSFREIPIETVYLEGNETSHFNPLTDSAKIYMPIVKFAGGSIFSSLIDLGFFTILIWLMRDMVDLDKQIFIATALARVVSSLFNYAFNRREVFASDEPRRNTMFRYYILCTIQTFISYKGVAQLVGMFGFQGFGKTIVKLIVDCILFLLTFQIQREWVFKKKKADIS